MATKGLVGGVNSSSNTVTASGTTPSAVTATITNATGVSASVGASPRSVSAGAVSNTLVPVEYTGVESDSLYITVDNSRRTITGSVKWRNFIANTQAEEQLSTYAYPANKAYINFINIDTRLDNLDDSFNELSSSFSRTRADVEQYAAKVTQFHSDLHTYKQLCEDHDNRISAESRARDALKLELTSYTMSLRTDLERQISIISKTVDTTVTSQESFGDKFSKDLNDEIKRAEAEESRIYTLANSNAGSIGSLKLKHTALCNDVSDLGNRISAIENLPISVFMEETRNSLDLTATRITGMDLRLTGRTTALSEDIAVLKNVTYQDRTRIGDLESLFNSALDKSKEVSQVVDSNKNEIAAIKLHQESETQLRDTQITSIKNQLNSEATLRQDYDKFHSDELVRLDHRISKLYEEFGTSLLDITNELRNKDDALHQEIYDMHYEFIDGGTAPIHGG